MNTMKNVSIGHKKDVFLIAIALGSFILAIVFNELPFVVISGLFISAVSLFFCWGPSLNNLFKHRPSGIIENKGEKERTDLQEKFKKFDHFSKNTIESIRLVVGEGRLFLYKEIRDSLKEALKRSVKIEIIFGDYDRENDEEFWGALIQENVNFLIDFKDELLSRQIKIYYGPREEEHFYIFDGGNRLIREPHPLGSSKPTWYWIEYPIHAGDLFLKKFGYLRNIKKPLYIQENNFSF